MVDFCWRKHFLVGGHHAAVEFRECFELAFLQGVQAIVGVAQLDREGVFVHAHASQYASVLGGGQHGNVGGVALVSENSVFTRMQHGAAQKLGTAPAADV